MSTMAETGSSTLEAALLDLEKFNTRIRIIRLKPGLREAIGHLLNGRDVLSVLPIGYGKSLIYQH